MEVQTCCSVLSHLPVRRSRLPLKRGRVYAGVLARSSSVLHDAPSCEHASSSAVLARLAPIMYLPGIVGAPGEALNETCLWQLPLALLGVTCALVTLSS